MTIAEVRRRAAAHSDALLTLAAFAIAVVTALPSGNGVTRSPWEIPLAVVACVPLLLRSRWPLAVAVVVVALDAVRITVVAHVDPAAGVIPAATMLALYTLALMRSPRVAWTTAVVVAAAHLSTAAFASGAPSVDALYLNWPLVSTAAGRLVLERRHRIAAAERRATEAEATRAAEARRQVTAERLRIAHELHDVLAHHIAAVNAQAGVAQYLLRTDPDAADTALTGIADNTRAALDELRVTLGLLRASTDEPPGGVRDDELRPTPGLDRLPTLVEGHRSAGMEVNLQVSGTPRPLPTAADLALYRICQEALTNACKHAPGSAAHVRLSWTETGVGAVVVNSAATGHPAPHLGTGNGLLGMRERAAAAGGTVSTAPTPDGGYRVVVEIPDPAVRS